MLVYWFSFPTRKAWNSLSVSHMNCFISVLAAIFRESSDKQFVLRIVKALPFIHQPDQAALKASDMSAADWLYQHTWKNTIFFHVCCYSLSQGLESLYNNAVYLIKRVKSNLVLVYLQGINFINLSSNVLNALQIIFLLWIVKMNILHWTYYTFKSLAGQLVLRGHPAIPYRCVTASYRFDYMQIMMS